MMYHYILVKVEAMIVVHRKELDAISCAPAIVFFYGTFLNSGNRILKINNRHLVSFDCFVSAEMFPFLVQPFFKYGAILCYF